LRAAAYTSRGRIRAASEAVRRDDYEAHLLAFYIGGAGFALGLFCESGAPFALLSLGGSLVASGFLAIRGGKSAVLLLVALERLTR
jgi:hypothetical protein